MPRMRFARWITKVTDTHTHTHAEYVKKNRLIDSHTLLRGVNNFIPIFTYIFWQILVKFGCGWLPCDIVEQFSVLWMSAQWKAYFTQGHKCTLSLYSTEFIRFWQNSVQATSTKIRWEAASSAKIKAMAGNLNLLKPTGHVMHHQFNIQQLYVLPTLYLCVLYLSENKQWLVPLTV